MSDRRNWTREPHIPSADDDVWIAQCDYPADMLKKAILSEEVRPGIDQAKLLRAASWSTSSWRWYASAGSGTIALL